jgi:hypothetical protein
MGWGGKSREKMVSHGNPRPDLVPDHIEKQGLVVNLAPPCARTSAQIKPSHQILFPQA